MGAEDSAEKRSVDATETASILQVFQIDPEDDDEEEVDEPESSSSEASPDEDPINQYIQNMRRGGGKPAERDEAEYMSDGEENAWMDEKYAPMTPKEELVFNPVTEEELERMKVESRAAHAKRQAKRRAKAEAKAATKRAKERPHVPLRERMEEKVRATFKEGVQFYRLLDHPRGSCGKSCKRDCTFNEWQLIVVANQFRHISIVRRYKLIREILAKELAEAAEVLKGSGVQDVEIKAWSPE